MTEGGLCFRSGGQCSRYLLRFYRHLCPGVCTEASRETSDPYSDCRRNRSGGRGYIDGFLQSFQEDDKRRQGKSLHEGFRSGCNHGTFQSYGDICDVHLVCFLRTCKGCAPDMECRTYPHMREPRFRHILVYGFMDSEPSARKFQDEDDIVDKQDYRSNHSHNRCFAAWTGTVQCAVQGNADNLIRNI